MLFMCAGADAGLAEGMSAIKQRDLAQDFGANFQWKVVEDGDDEDGDPVSSLVMLSTNRQPDPETRRILGILEAPSGDGRNYDAAVMAEEEDLPSNRLHPSLHSGTRALGDDEWPPRLHSCH